MIIIRFDDVRDARKAHIAIEANLPHAAFITPLTSGDLAKSSADVRDPLCYLFEGQIVVTAFWAQDARRPLSANDAVASLKRFLARFGEVKALQSFPMRQPRVRDFRVEFYQVASAAELLRATQGRVIQSEVSQLILAFYSVSPKQYLCIEAEPFFPVMQPPQSATHAVAAPIGRSPEQISITGRSMVPADPGYTQIVGNLVSDEGYSRRRGGQGQYTRIDVDRISQGLDVRTTVSIT